MVTVVTSNGPWWVFVAVLGLVVGSFLNVVVHRWPRGESIVRPRSRCPACGAGIAAWDNVPLLSYAWLRGRCRGCGTSISARYPLIELGTGLCFVALFARHGLAPETLVLWCFAAVLIAAAGIDFDHGYIPDELSLGGFVFALAAMPAARAISGDAWAAALAQSALGAALGAGALWSVGFAHARLSVAFGRTFPHWPGEGEATPRPGSVDYWTWFPGLGFGDVKLIGMVGAFLGPLGVVYSIVLAALFGLPLGLLQMRASGGFSAPFGFGPALASAALVVAVWAPHGL